MPLRDHFHPPMAPTRQWPGFHAMWLSKLAGRLNEALLSARYRADIEVHHGTQITVDLGTYDQGLNGTGRPTPGNSSGGTAVAVAAPSYAPPAPTFSAEVSIADPDVFELRVYYDSGGAKLVAAVELVSPANKDRPDTRRAFAVKCAAYIQKGVSVVVVDVVTERRSSPHADLVELLGLPAEFSWESPTGLSAVGYRTVQRDGKVRLDVWPYPTSVGAELPVVPLWLDFDLAVPLELEPTYAAACKSLRIG